MFLEVSAHDITAQLEFYDRKTSLTVDTPQQHWNRMKDKHVQTDYESEWESAG